MVSGGGSGKGKWIDKKFSDFGMQWFVILLPGNHWQVLLFVEVVALQCDLAQEYVLPFILLLRMNNWKYKA